MASSRSLRVAALVKQIPRFEVMELGPEGRIVRDGLELEMDAYSRRAVAKGVDLARQSDGSCTAFSLGPPTAEDALREAVAWGADEGVLVTDPVFAGSDTLATARALAAALRLRGPFDLILAGRNSLDAETGQVPPELAELLDLPFATGVRQLEVSPSGLRVGCEHDDEWLEAEMELPALLSCAERLCEPAKVPPELRTAVPAERITVLDAADLGPGAWGQSGSPTWVGEVRVLDVQRRREVMTGPVDGQVARAVERLEELGALDPGGDRSTAEQVPAPTGQPVQVIGVLLEEGRPRVARELLGAAARLAHGTRSRVVALGVAPTGRESLGGWGADSVIGLKGAEAPEDVAEAVGRWAEEVSPWAVLAPGTAWGREVASRVAASRSAGLTGDAIGLEVEGGRLLAWKQAFGGRTVAAIHCSSPSQLVTVRPGVLAPGEPRPVDPPERSVRRIEPRRRFRVTSRRREDDSMLLAEAERVVAVGQGVPPDAYPRFEELLRVLGAESAATRKVTDQGWMPRARQLGVTGHSISPRLFVAVGTSGRFNFMAGSRLAGTVLAVNPDPEAPVWEWVDVGILAPWEEAIPLLTRRLSEVFGEQGSDLRSV